MEKQILAHLKIGGRTFSRYIQLPIEPVPNMKLTLTCEDTKRGIFEELDLEITDIIYIEKDNQLIYVMYYLPADQEHGETACFESENWSEV